MKSLVLYISSAADDERYAVLPITPEVTETVAKLRRSYEIIATALRGARVSASEIEINGCTPASLTVPQWFPKFDEFTLVESSDLEGIKLYDEDELFLYPIASKNGVHWEGVDDDGFHVATAHVAYSVFS